MKRFGWALLLIAAVIGLGFVSMIRFETTPSAREKSPQVPQVTPLPETEPEIVETASRRLEPLPEMPLGQIVGERAPLFAGPPPPLQVPVAGIDVGDLRSNWGDARDGGERLHTGLDIMAPSGTQVVAATDGIIEKLYLSEGGGGITLYLRSADRNWLLYYAHLGGYAPGIAEGRRVRAGEPLGFVGDTGNAAPGNHHLHFGVSHMQPGERWHQGTPVDPYPLLAAMPAGG